MSLDSNRTDTYLRCDQCGVHSRHIFNQFGRDLASVEAAARDEGWELSQENTALRKQRHLCPDCRKAVPA